MTQLGESSKQSGKTITGVVLGLIAGLAIAVIVALYITRGPKPLVSKPMITKPDISDTSHMPSKELHKSTKPNKKPFNVDTEDDQFDDSQIIEVPPKKSDKTPQKIDSSINTHTPNVHEKTRPGYYLQVGAYKTESGAEQQRARLALQGFEAKVTQHSDGNITYYRVRLGPFAQSDEANQVHQRLTTEGINAIAIRLQK